MVQVLQRIPGFGERLAQVLGEAVGNVGESYVQGKKKQNAFDNFQRLNPSSGAPNNVADLQSQGGPDMAQGGVQGLPGQIPQQQSAIKSAENLSQSYEYLKLAKGKEVADAWLKIQTGDRDLALKESSGVREKQRELAASRAEIAPAFERLDELEDYVGRWGVNAVLGKVPYTEASEKREEVDKLGFWVTDKVYTHFNKGTITDKKLELIQKDLAPRAGLSQKEYRARVNALKRIAGLPSDIAPKKFDAVVDSEIKKIKKIPPEQDKRPSLKSFYE